VPTLVLTSLPIPQPHQFNVHAVSLPDLLESNLRWHIRLAQTMRRYAEIREHFEDAGKIHHATRIIACHPASTTPRPSIGR
jgi:hypothetical protein